ncbi:hypothetical protein GGF37_003578, partial [Kickxella alabastrina]
MALRRRSPGLPYNLGLEDNFTAFTVFEDPILQGNYDAYNDEDIYRVMDNFLQVWWRRVQRTRLVESLMQTNPDEIADLMDCFTTTIRLREKVEEQVEIYLNYKKVHPLFLPSEPSRSSPSTESALPRSQPKIVFPTFGVNDKSMMELADFLVHFENALNAIKMGPGEWGGHFMVNVGGELLEFFTDHCSKIDDWDIAH